jgi:creatinine amidohydrolase/Fe(II)-dependent formamide hydrolase-like protein
VRKLDIILKELCERKSQLITSFIAITLGITVIVGIRTVTYFSEKAVALELDNLGANVLILPTIPYAIVLQHGMERNPHYPGIIGVRDDTLRAVLTDVARCLACDGIRKLILLNYHGGNSQLLPVIACHIEAEVPELHVFTHFAIEGMDIAGLFPDEVTGHGCAFETSLDLALCPEHVWLDTNPPVNQPRGLHPEPPARLRHFPDWVYTTRGHGYIGDPKQASAEKGETMVEQALAVFVPTVETIARLDVKELEPPEKPNAPFRRRQPRGRGIEV